MNGRQKGWGDCPYLIYVLMQQTCFLTREPLIDYAARLPAAGVPGNNVLCPFDKDDCGCGWNEDRWHECIIHAGLRKEMADK